MALLAWSWVFTLPGLLLTALGAPGGRRGAGLASIPGPVVLLVAAIAALLPGGTADVVYPGWLPFLPDGAYRAHADALSALMLVILGFVATLVYVYSLGYMADDPGRRRFFVYLDLFVSTMTLLVLAGNLAVLLIGWTGVGLSSFLLISFWRDRPGTLGAGLQALAANAIGDGALLLAAVLVPAGCGALTELATLRCTSGVGGAELLAGLLVVAAAAKSAQGPLYFWLPSAMAGPTPISALIHAATMVAAGVYLLVRTHALLALAPTASLWTAAVGVATALAASVGSLMQANFKRGIAYSTIAQLGYMFAAASIGAPFAAIFHLTTHAAFKALLFLSAGVVIHGMGGEESLAHLSGLGRRFPFSYGGFLVGSLALIGFPLTSGALSKDAIIEAALERQPIVGWLLLGGAALTGLYIGRLFFRVYHGPVETGRAGEREAGRAGESAAHYETGEQHDSATARLMDWPLVPLMAASVIGGVIAWPGGWLQQVLSSTVGEAHAVELNVPTGWIAAALGLVGFGVSGWLARAPARRVAPAEVASQAGWVGVVADAGYSVARWLSGVHSGQLPRYAFGSVFAVAAILLAREMFR